MKRLALKKETLVELAADDLRAVQGGAESLASGCLHCIVDAVTEATRFHTDRCLPTLNTCAL